MDQLVYILPNNEYFQSKLKIVTTIFDITEPDFIEVMFTRKEMLINIS